jgi:hypothetical protein
MVGVEIERTRKEKKTSEQVLHQIQHELTLRNHLRP